MNLPATKNKISSTLEHLLLVALLVSLAAMFVHNDVLWRWDNLLYDTQLSFWSRNVSDDIVIVAIDDESLYELGHWPWPRSIHAELINKINRESPSVIGLDIIFNEADEASPESDQALSDAIRDSGKVVMPVLMAQSSTNSVPIEALPLAEFTRHVAQLGHVHIAISKDGIARKVYLREGIGEPHWMHYSLAILSQTNAQIDLPESVTDQAYSSMQWSRELPVFIPYAGPPGHFTRIGFSQVLSGQYPKDLFRNKIVLIGATAEGMGDALPTPLSSQGGTMPGVEIIANMIDALMNDIRIVEIDRGWLVLITAILVALPILIYPYLNPSTTLMVMVSILLVTSAMVASFLWFFGIWIPLSTILFFQFLSYPLWSWRRLVLAMRHLNRELDQLLERQQDSSLRYERNLPNELKFISAFIPLSGWIMFDEKGGRVLQQGDVPPKARHALEPNKWLVKQDQCWASFYYQGQMCKLGLKLKPGVELSDEDYRLLDNLIQLPQQVSSPQVRYLEDVFQTRIEQVQAVGNEYEALHQIVDDSLSSMADGVLICSGQGQVMLSNRRAGWYLYADDNAEMKGKSLMQLLQQLQLKDNSNWKSLLQRVLLNQERILAEAQHESGRDLMVEISPLAIVGDEVDGLVVNLSDISLLKRSERERNEVLNFLSHDLRSPLSSMIAMIELTKNKNSIEEMRSMLDGMEKNTYKTLHLAEQFLQLARANTNENIEFYDIDFNTIVLNAVDQLWALSDKLQVSIEYEFEQDEIWTHAEPDLLERAVTNLLSNALKHSQAREAVYVNVKLVDQEIVCCILDTGAGIAQQELPHLFEMFSQTRGAGIERKKGIGLGLAFVDAVARRHSGSIEVDSILGKGSIFCLKIPRLDTVEQ